MPVLEIRLDLFIIEGGVFVSSFCVPSIPHERRLDQCVRFLVPNSPCIVINLVPRRFLKVCRGPRIHPRHEYVIGEFNKHDVMLPKYCHTCALFL